MASVPALELDTDAAGYTRETGVHFGGFPGVWEPGRPVEITELGFATVEDALAQVDELALPLRQVDVDPGSAPMPERTNHLFSEEQQVAVDNRVGEQPVKRWTHRELDEAAAAANLTWPADVKKVDEKVAFLEAVREGTVTTEGEQTDATDDDEETA